MENEASNPKVQQVHQYTAHNFESMNRAIDNEVEKQEMWTTLYHHHQREKGARTFFYVISSVCVIGLTAAVVWWLLLAGGTQARFVPANIDQVELISSEASLKEISKVETVETSEAPFINTTFTVFHRTLTPSGEEVVTGKTYEPSSLNTPYEQYCYLESASKSGALEAKPLAIFDTGKVVLETQDPGLIQYAERYCRFSF